MLRGIQEINKRRKGIGIYARVSTQEQRDTGYSIDMQIGKIRQYIELFDFKCDNIDIFVDDATGRNMNRKGLKSLLEKVENNSIDLIIIYKLDRLSRSIIDVYTLIALFDKYNCNLISVVDNLDTSSANGRLVVGLLAIFAQWETETISERTIDGVMEMLQEGKYPFKDSPFGYDKDENLFLHVNSHEKELMEFMVEKIKSDVNLVEISKLLYEIYNVKMNPEKIKRIINSDFALCRVKYQGIYFDNIIPKIIDPEDIQESRRMLSKKRKVRDNANYLFGNKIRCTCGAIMDHESTKKPNKRYYYYKCPTCNGRINQDKVLENTIDYILTYSNDIENKASKKRLAKRLSKIGGLINQVLGEYESSSIDYKTYVARMYRYEQERESIYKDIETLESMNLLKWNKYTNTKKKKYLNHYVQTIEVDVRMQMITKINLKKID